MESSETLPKNRHCVWGPIRERLDEIVRNIINGKLQIVRKRKKADTETEDIDDNDDDEEIPEETGDRVYVTSEHDGNNEPIPLNPETDVIQIHTTNSERLNEYSEPKIRPLSRNTNRLNRYGSRLYTRTFMGKIEKAI